MRILVELFLTFAKIGLFTFGGGYAMIAMIENICVERKQWITHDEMMDVTVLAESTPGPIAINCSTYTGYQRGGLPGAIAATLGIVTPSFIIIFILSMFLDNYLSVPVIAHAFLGIKIGVGILIVDVAIKMIQKMKKQRLPIVTMILACICVILIDAFAWNFSVVGVMLVAAIIHLALFAVREKSKKKVGDKQ